jgi:hypothetical protein
LIDIKIHIIDIFEQKSTSGRRGAMYEQYMKFAHFYVCDLEKHSALKLSISR